MAEKKKKVKMQRIECIKDNQTSEVNGLLKMGWRVKMMHSCTGTTTSQVGTTCYVVLEKMVDSELYRPDRSGMSKEWP
jgi:hypothetical protein